MTRVTVLGLGAMGSRMAARLVQAGHAVTVWNRTPVRPLAAAGAKPAPTPRAAVDGAECVVAMVRDDDASRSIWLDAEAGALAGMAPDAVAIESSTLTVAWVRELAGRCADAGVRFLDAPVFGSRPHAEAGQLIHLVGGAPETLARTEPLLAAMGGAVHHVGEAGSGTALKLAVNLLFGVQVAAMAEILALARRAGVDPARAADIVGATPVCSLAAKAAAASMLAGSFAPLFPVELVEKDLGYAIGAAGSPDAAPMAAAARAVFAQAIDRGLGGDNLTAVARLYSELP